MVSLGVADWCLDGPRCRALQASWARGLQFIQVDSGAPGQADWLGAPAAVEELRSAARQTGVSLSAIAFNFLNDADRAVLRTAAYWDNVWAILPTAEALRVPLLIVPWFGNNDIRNSTDFEFATRLLAQLCRRAAKFGGLVAAETSLNWPSHTELARQVACANFRLVVDLQNMLLFEDPLDRLLTEWWGLKADQVHVKDGRDGVMGNAQIGTGIPSVLSGLRRVLEAGFEGVLILENEYNSFPDLDLGKDIETVAQLLRNVPEPAHFLK